MDSESSGNPRWVASARLVLPSEVGGDTTAEVGFFEIESDQLARWLAAALGSNEVRAAGWQALSDAVMALTSKSPIHIRHAVVPLSGWSLLMTSGPHGTDVGMLPSAAARELGIRAIRAVASDSGRYPARILEVFGPGGPGPLSVIRAIAAANDGGRWVYETSGDPLPFERQSESERRRIGDRLTSAYLYELLEGLGVPFDRPPDWENALLVED